MQKDETHFGVNPNSGTHIYCLELTIEIGNKSCTVGPNCIETFYDGNTSYWWDIDDLSDFEENNFIITNQYNFGEESFWAVTKRSYCNSCLDDEYGPAGCDDVDEINAYYLDYTPNDYNYPCSKGGFIAIPEWAAGSGGRSVPVNGISTLVESVDKCGCLFPAGVIPYVFSPSPYNTSAESLPVYVEFDCNPDEILDDEFYDCSELYEDCFNGCSDEFIGMTVDYLSCIYEVTCLDNNQVIDERIDDSYVCYKWLDDWEETYVLFHFCECGEPGDPDGFKKFSFEEGSPAGLYEECPCEIEIPPFAPDPEDAYSTTSSPDNPDIEILIEANIARQLTFSEDLKMKFYPNPFNNYLNIEIESKKDQTLKVKLINVFGRMVKSNDYELKKGTQQLKLNGLQSLPEGLYFVLLEDENGKTKMFKLMHTAY